MTAPLLQPRVPSKVGREVVVVAGGRRDPVQQLLLAGQGLGGSAVERCTG